MQKNFKMTEPLAHGYSSESTQRELPNEYQHDSVYVVFKDLCVLVLWTEVASAMEGLAKYNIIYHCMRRENSKVCEGFSDSTRTLRFDCGER